MKNKLIVVVTLLFGFSLITYGQEAKHRCYFESSDGTKIECSCEYFKPHTRPEYTFSWDVDSVEQSMEYKLIESINNYRVSIGLNPLVYNQKLYNELTLPHNRYQVKNQYCGHDDHMGNKLKERGPALNFCGFKSLGENVADHQRWDGKGRSHFFEQYMDSPKHRELIEDPKWVYYSTSVIYNSENNRFYNTFNVSR